MLKTMILMERDLTTLYLRGLEKVKKICLLEIEALSCLIPICELFPETT